MALSMLGMPLSRVHVGMCVHVCVCAHTYSYKPESPAELLNALYKPHFPVYIREIFFVCLDIVGKDGRELEIEICIKNIPT